MKKIILLLIIIPALGILFCSCAVWKKPLDRRYDFSKNLKETEKHIKDESWTKAESSLKQTEKAWFKIKPFMQLDIDHDYINDIEDNFDILRAYIETEEKPDALATIYLIWNNWMNIDSM